MHKRCAEGEGRGGLSKFSDALPCAKKFDLKIDEILKCADPDQVTKNALKQTRDFTIKMV